jgi:cation diffusion facilitator family transporter
MAACTGPALDPCSGTEHLARQRRVLWIVLAINLSMFVVEIVAGWYAGSTALLADALDFLADSAAYGITIFVVARSVRWKAAAALAKGAGMGVFGFWVLAETVRRLFDPAVPDAAVMGGVGVLALAANAFCALLLFWRRGDDLNMRSVWLCSRNDAIANLAVLLAAGGVFATATAWPDLAAGALIVGLELTAAWSIVRQAVRELRASRVPAPG